MGPTKLEYIGKKMANMFWRDVFISVKEKMQGSLLSVPEKIPIAPFWDNTALTKNNYKAY